MKLFKFRVAQRLGAAVWAEDEYDASEKIWKALDGDFVLTCEDLVDTDVDVLEELDPEENDIYYIINPYDIPED